MSGAAILHNENIKIKVIILSFRDSIVEEWEKDIKSVCPGIHGMVVKAGTGIVRAPRRECSTLAYQEGLYDEDDAWGGIVQGNYSKQRLQVFWVAGGKWNALPLLFVSSLITLLKHFGALLSSLVSPEWSVSIRNQALGLRFVLKTYQMVALPSWWNGAFPRGEVEDECLGLVMHDLSS